MLDKHESRRRASQPLVFSASRSSNQEPLPSASSFLLAGLNAFRPRTNRTKDDAVPRRMNKLRRDSNTNSGSSDSEGVANNDGVIEVLSVHTKGTRSDAEDGNINGYETEDIELSSSGKRSLNVWHRLQQLAPKRKSAANPATVMYSISFYPWKMEPHGYYSHPEAAANWVPDTASARCQICLAAFTLTRRRHHCRLCGHLVCADCSHDRTYLPFAGGTPSQHRLIKDGAPQRTCSSCASTLRNMAGQDDYRVKRFTVAVSSVRRRKSIASATSVSSTRSVIEVEVERPSPWLRRSGLALTDSDIEDEEFFIESTKALQLDQRSRGTTHHFPLRLSVTRAEELDEILSARACSRVQSGMNLGDSSQAGSRQFVISSAWLDQWLQYVRVDSASADTAASYSSAIQLSDRNKSEGRHHKSTARCRMSRPRRPGPVANYVLLDFVNGELVPKPNLQRSRGSFGGGDYRVVSQEVWVTFLELYGGGPSIQVPLNNDTEPRSKELVLASNRTVNPRSHAPESSRRDADVPQWIISELDDSLPALAVSSPIDNYSSATRKGAARKCGSQTECIQHQAADSSISTTRTRQTPGKRLISAASMSSLVKKPLNHFPKRPESPRFSSPSRWKLWETETSRARAETMVCERASEVTTADAGRTGSRNTEGDASSTLAAVSAFANAATLARKRSAVSLTRHSAAISSRTNGSGLENE
ncbi:hypothetical protein PRIC2_001109 [Phytophthora ramorum]